MHARTPYPYEQLQETEPALYVENDEATTSIFVVDENVFSQ